MIKIIYNNRFYFWILFISMTCISYLSIYQSLVINRTYTLVAVFFLKYISLFFLYQMISMLLILLIINRFSFLELNNNVTIQLNKKYNIILIYIIGLVSFILLTNFKAL